VTTDVNDTRATIVILAWNAWDETRACLDSLERNFDPRDQVIVVDNGSVDATREGLTRYSWIEVIANETNQGFAAGSNQGAAAARGEFIVFLNNDTVVSEGWLEELLAPFKTPDVAAVGPRSNNVSGIQQINDVQYQLSGYAGVWQYASQWRQLNTGRTSEVTRLVGFCLAVRTRAFRAVGGFDEGYRIGGFEDDDLCLKLRNAGHVLLIAHGSYVHHTGHATFDANRVNWIEQQNENQKRFEGKWKDLRTPAQCLLSVCLIVKDEEALLGACLESVVDVADEIVVYDTGSSDRTVEIARAAGATVIEGYWDDDFSRARNSALEHAHGEWVLSLDADETFLSDPAALRRLLSQHSAEVEAFMIAIENLQGAGNTRTVHTATRMFRRTAVTWRNRLHEQVGAKDNPERGLRTGYLSAARIIHRGYVAEVFDARGKAERNLKLAKASLEDEGISKPYALMNYGRALASAGKAEEAIEALRESVTIADGPTAHRMGLMNLVYTLASVERYDEAFEAIAELRHISISPIAADIAEGRMRIATSDTEAGLALLARVPHRGRDDDGMEYAAHTLASIRGEALASLGRFGEAADVVLDTIRTDGVLEADMDELVQWLLRDNRQPVEIAQALDVDDLMPVLARVLRQSPATADPVLEGIFQRFPDRLEPLAAAGRVARRFGVARALVWSSRLRARGFASACPLVAMVNDATLDPRERILAGAAAFGSFADRAVVNGVNDARAQLNAQDLLESTEQIARLAPGLLEAQHAEPEAPRVTGAPAAAPLGHGRETRARLTLAPVHPQPQRGGVNIVGAFESTSVRGEIARCIAGALTRYGYPVSTTSYEPEGRKGPVPWHHRDAGDHPYDTTLLVMSPEELTNYVMDHGAASFEGRYMIGVWQPEIDRPQETLALSAQMVHEIWAPSKFTADMVRGLTDRRVVQVAIPVSTVSQASRTTPSASGVVFLTSVDYAAGFQRQNPLAVVAAYRAAFEEPQDVRLVIEAAHASRYPFEHGALVKAIAGRPDITLAVKADGATGRITQEGSAEHSCYVSLHRSEGTGLALSRAMNLGIVAITTAHSVGAEFLGERDSFQIPFTLEDVPSREVRDGQALQWAAPDVERAALAMRHVAQDPKAMRLMARKSRERAKRALGPSHLVRMMRDRLTEIDQLRHPDAASAENQLLDAVSSAG
jgi:GT2 family glycosyltransferase/tetratricopeptide (TPR) repeat protein